MELELCLPQTLDLSNRIYKKLFTLVNERDFYFTLQAIVKFYICKVHFHYSRPENIKN